MDKETVDAIKEALTPVAEKIGEGGEFLYRLAIKQSYVEGTRSLIIAVALLIGIYVTWRGFKVFTNRCKDTTGSEQDDWVMWTIMYGIVGGIAVLVMSISFVINVTEGVSRFINPEWYAFKIIFDSVVPK